MLIIFDCDGVLVDSEVIGAEVFSEELARHGIELNAVDCHRQFQGLTLQDCMSWLRQKFSVRLPEDFLTTLEAQTALRFKRDLKPVDGILEVLSYLDEQNVPYCVASNGGYGKINGSLEVTGLLSYFQGRIFSADSVTAGKPDPALFLWAAESMGVPPRFCTVIEDSRSGLQAAQAAGMKVFHYSRSGSGQVEVPVFEDMRELPVLLRSTIGNRRHI